MGTLVKAAQAFLFCLISILSPLSSFGQSDDLAMKSQRAREFMADGKFAEAIPLYRELNQAVPNNHGLLLNLGMALHMVLGLQPDHRGALEMLAGSLLSFDRAAEAADQYRKLADLDPESSPAWYGLGRSYESLSLRAFDELQKTAPESVYWLALVAEARLREQQFSSAFYLYRHAVEKMPTMRSLHAAVAEIYRQTGHPDWANVEEEKERQLPQPDCRTQTFECEFQAGQYSGLVVSAQRAHTPESHYWRSRAYNELALQAFTRLGRLPPSREQHELKAHIYSGQKRYAEAAGEWREARKFSPGDPQIQKQLAISLKF